MMKLLQCVLVMLNLYFATGHEDFTQSTLNKLENADNLNNMKYVIDKRDVVETLYDVENVLENSASLKKKTELKNDLLILMLFVNASKSNTDKKEDTKKVFYDDVFLDNQEGGHLIGRSVANFLKVFLGLFGIGGGGGGKLIDVDVGHHKVGKINNSVSGYIGFSNNVSIHQRRAQDETVLRVMHDLIDNSTLPEGQELTL